MNKYFGILLTVSQAPLVLLLAVLIQHTRVVQKYFCFSFWTLALEWNINYMFILIICIFDIYMIFDIVLFTSFKSSYLVCEYMQTWISLHNFFTFSFGVLCILNLLDYWTVSILFYPNSQKKKTKNILYWLVRHLICLPNNKITLTLLRN